MQKAADDATRFGEDDLAQALRVQIEMYLIMPPATAWWVYTRIENVVLIGLGAPQERL